MTTTLFLPALAFAAGWYLGRCCTTKSARRDLDAAASERMDAEREREAATLERMGAEQQRIAAAIDREAATRAYELADTARREAEAALSGARALGRHEAIVTIYGAAAYDN